MASLTSNGWQVFDGIDGPDSLLDLAKSLGVPRLAPTGELVKELTPIAKDLARKGTFAANHGFSAYPLHTDTAFWKVPARLVLLHVSWDLRRETLLYPWSEVLSSMPKVDLERMQDGIWQVGVKQKFFLGNVSLGAAVSSGYRWDLQCMKPLTRLATQVSELISIQLRDASPLKFTWRPQTALVIDNWQVLHGRARGPASEGKRRLFRVYAD